MSFFEIPLLSTAISVIIAWALFSILCSQVHEFISSLKGERGRFMKKYLFKQFRDVPNEINWATSIYDQGNVDLLIRAPGKPSSELPPEELAKGLLSTVCRIHIVGAEDPGNKTFNVAGFRNRLTLLKSSPVVELLRQADAEASLKAKSRSKDEDSSLVYEYLLSNISEWFVTFEQRLSLWYKKKTKERLFLLGLVLAVFVNIDSIELFKFFNINPQARTAVQQFYLKQVDSLQNQTQINLSELNSRQQATITAQREKTIELERIKYTISNLSLKNLNQDSLQTLKVKADSMQKQILESQAALKELSVREKAVQAFEFSKKLAELAGGQNINIGYQYNILSGNFSGEADFSDYLVKIVGLLISAFAASMGGPFWFDLLKTVYKKS